MQVVDDNEALRTVACLEVELSDHLELAGWAADGKQAVAVAVREQPDAILLDLEMPGLSGLEALPQLLEAVPDAIIVVYTSRNCERTRQEVLRSGAEAYVVKGETPLRSVLELLRRP